MSDHQRLSLDYHVSLVTVLSMASRMGVHTVTAGRSLVCVCIDSCVDGTLVGNRSV